jgi:hypothetical protein
VKSKQPGKIENQPPSNERACRFRHVLKGGSFLAINPNEKESIGSDTVNTAAGVGDI